MHCSILLLRNWYDKKNAKIFQSFDGHSILFIKMVLVKKLLYSGNFNLGKDFGHKQKVKPCLFICANELWVLNFFFFKKWGCKIILSILSYKAAISCLQNHANYNQTTSLPSTFSQPLLIYYMCVARRNSLLKKVVFFYSARIKNFSQLFSTIFLTNTYM